MMTMATVLATAPIANAVDMCWLVSTVSGKVYCKVQTDSVFCGAGSVGGFQSAPTPHNAYLPSVTSEGTFQWVYAGGLGGCDNLPQVLNYGVTQNIKGWTIQPDQSGTRFTNNANSHGMFVSVENVYAF